jgi:hypothetical protein
VKCGIIPGHAQLRGQIRKWRQDIRAGVAKTSSLPPGATEVPIGASKKRPARERRCQRCDIALPTASEKPPATATALSAVISGS